MIAEMSRTSCTADTSAMILKSEPNLGKLPGEQEMHCLTSPCTVFQAIMPDLSLPSPRPILGREECCVIRVAKVSKTYLHQ